MRALCVNQVELINQRCESIAVVDDIAAVVLARDRAFECQLLGYGTHLQDVLVLGVVTSAHLHVEHTTQGVVVVGVKG